MKKAYLILENGKVFEGIQIGAEGEAAGELVFTTGVVGYLETLTDPAYKGQIIMQTFPLIGNYGVMEADLEGECSAGGYVVHELCDTPSNFRSEYDLNTFLKKNGVPGIAGVDTREITRIIRREGTMRALLTDSAPSDCALSFASVGLNKAGCTERIVCKALGEAKYRVSLLDFGMTQSFPRLFTARGCEVLVMPQSTSAADILAEKPDGVVLSGGPGNPEDYTHQIEEIKKIIGKVPVFAVGLGHQLIALAMGGKTVKLNPGHRGANQPAKSMENGRTYITTQNHGYAVLAESLAGVAEETFVNLNDQTNEGLIYPGKMCKTFQFYPDAYSGAFIPDAFIEEMGGKTNA